jgi:hypothetical protein
MIAPSNGLVVHYNYLWARQFDRREVSGRKARPACVQIIVAGNAGGTVVALFPITSQPPDADRSSVEIPEMEARRAGLAVRCWIVVDEWNLDDLAKSPHLADVHPLGAFSPAFIKRIRTAAADRIRARRYRAVSRR